MSEEERETLHDYSIEIAKVIAEVFGWRVKSAPATKKGPDLIIEHLKESGNPDAKIYLESEVGHDQGGAKEYFQKISRRVKDFIIEDTKNNIHSSLVIITNAPKRLTSYLRNNRDKLAQEIGFEKIVDGWNIFIIPAFIASQLLPAVFIRALGALGRYA